VGLAGKLQKIQELNSRSTRFGSACSVRFDSYAERYLS
jgi:hypothetical protein